MAWYSKIRGLLGQSPTHEAAGRGRRSLAWMADRPDGLMVARHAIVADHALQWPAGITLAEQQAAVLQLKALGVLVRAGA